MMNLNADGALKGWWGVFILTRSSICLKYLGLWLVPMAKLADDILQRVNCLDAYAEKSLIMLRAF
jgi:hypothetical protein